MKILARIPAVFLSLISLVACLAPGSGQAATENWPGIGTSFGGVFQNVTVAVTNLYQTTNGGGGIILPLQVRFYFSDTSGNVAMTNLYPNTYSATVKGQSGAPFTVYFLITNFTQVNNITDNGVIPTNYPSTYTTITSDATFARLNGTGLGGTPQVISNSWVVTNVDSSIVIGTNAAGVTTIRSTGGGGGGDLFTGTFGITFTTNSGTGVVTASNNIAYPGTNTFATNSGTAVNFSGTLAGDVTGTQGATVVSGATVTPTSSKIVRRDISGNIVNNSFVSGIFYPTNTYLSSAPVFNSNSYAAFTVSADSGGYTWTSTQPIFTTANGWVEGAEFQTINDNAQYWVVTINPDATHLTAYMEYGSGAAQSYSGQNILISPVAYYTTDIGRSVIAQSVGGDGSLSIVSVNHAGGMNSAAIRFMAGTASFLAEADNNGGTGGFFRVRNFYGAVPFLITTNAANGAVQILSTVQIGEAMVVNANFTCVNTTFANVLDAMAANFTNSLTLPFLTTANAFLFTDGSGHVSQTLSGANLTTLNASAITSGTVPAANLPTATTGALGAVKVDGTSITISGGTISATTGGGGSVTSVSGPDFLTWVSSTTTPTATVNGTTAKLDSVKATNSINAVYATASTLPTFDSSKNLVSSSVSSTEAGYLSGVTSAIQTQLNGKFATGATLAGDVTGTPGATVVAQVGGATAANVASGANAANAATSANTISTIVARDGSGNFSATLISANITGANSTSTTLSKNNSVTTMLETATNGIIDLGPTTNAPLTLGADHGLTNAPVAANGQVVIYSSSTQGGMAGTTSPSISGANLTSASVPDAALQSDVALLGRNPQTFTGSNIMSGGVSNSATAGLNNVSIGGTFKIAGATAAGDVWTDSAGTGIGSWQPSTGGTTSVTTGDGLINSTNGAIVITAFNGIGSQSNLIYWRAKLALLNMGSNVQAVVNCYGDSWFSDGFGNNSNQFLVAAITKSLKNKYGNAGDGWLWASTFNGLYYNGPQGKVFWTNGQASGLHGSSMSQDLMDLGSGGSAPAGSAMFYTNANMKNAWIVFDNHFGNAAFTIKTNSVLAITTTTSPGITCTNIVFPTQGSNVIEVDFAGCSSTFIYGIDVETTNAGVRVNNFGYASSTMDDWATQYAISGYYLKNFNLSVDPPDLGLILLGQNDLNNGIIATLAADTATVEHFFVTNSPKSSVVCIARPDVDLTNSGSTMANVEALLRTTTFAVNNTNSIAYLDAYHASPNYGDGAAYSPSMYQNGVHLNNFGYNIFANLIYRFIDGGNIIPANVVNFPGAPVAITFPLTTVNWTNFTGYNIEIYVDNTGVTGTAIKKNGGQIFSSLTGDATFRLRPNEYFSESYTIGTPVGVYSVIQ